ncbi:Mam3p [Sugiyamaella lignohabitans]|uniref:Mam3p n=1 Tax=Sugiyamaella lignohabitans TaxID=796027 RepID=A0A167E1T9_9ASCO|nr:Mam3p [Sugiyamaella lignohabitans]ANB13544.1 Mam3p [Sugiyamaella lignohabitans]
MSESDGDPSICCHAPTNTRQAGQLNGAPGTGVTALAPAVSHTKKRAQRDRKNLCKEHISASGKVVVSDRNIKDKSYKIAPISAIVPNSDESTGSDTTVEMSTGGRIKLGTSTTLSIARLLVALIGLLPAISAYPIHHASIQESSDGDGPALEDESDFLLNMSVSAFLVILGGVFAGLTLGLMGQDEIYLEVMKQSGSPSERKSADKVLTLLSKGKHWVLVTLLLGNVITNETLPIVLDRCLGGGWPAVVSSTVAIVIFGEIIPQSISVRYGLAVGAAFAPFVLGLMYLMYPVAYPIALLLDHTLGEGHGTVYKKAGLKTLVTLHKNMGVERLNQDEVTIISAVLDLKEKPVGTIMTPMEDVFVLSADTILDEKTMEQILHTGFNRIPIHEPGEPENFIGMLLVRILITYDPEDALPISSFPLATLPETGPDTSCLNILNYFQEGKSHMIIVSDNPGEPYGALGVLTLEDVIEELIGEEIVDESDVYIDVHKAIRRAHPGPLTKTHSYNHVSGEVPNGTTNYTATNGSSTADTNTTHDQIALETPPTRSSPRTSLCFENVLTALASHSQEGAGDRPFPKLGPSNKASNPIPTTTRNITVKRALGTGPNTAGTNSAVNSPLIPASGGPKNASKTEPYHTSHGTRGGSSGSIPIDDQLLSVPTAKKGPVTVSELGAVQEALASSVGKRSFEHDHDGDLAYESRVVSPSIPESHSYRVGGIIESVINVHGVNKVVIEDVSVHSDQPLSNRSSPSNSIRSNRDRDGSNDDTRPLLSPK